MGESNIHRHMHRNIHIHVHMHISTKHTIVEPNISSSNLYKYIHLYIHRDRETDKHIHAHTFDAGAKLLHQLLQAFHINSYVHIYTDAHTYIYT